MSISWRQFASAVFLTILCAFTLSNPAYATPPTHYLGGYGPLDPTSVTDLSPERVANGLIANRNAAWAASGGYTWEIPGGSCYVHIATGQQWFSCPYDHCSTISPCSRVDGDIALAMCGPQRAVWDGSSFTCPPEPDCSTPAQ